MDNSTLPFTFKERGQERALALKVPRRCPFVLTALATCFLMELSLDLKMEVRLTFNGLHVITSISQMTEVFVTSAPKWVLAPIAGVTVTHVTTLSSGWTD
jgi:hypothetical protein